MARHQGKTPRGPWTTPMIALVGVLAVLTVFAIVDLAFGN